MVISEWPNFRYDTFTNNAGGTKENVLTILMVGFTIVIVLFWAIFVC